MSSTSWVGRSVQAQGGGVPWQSVHQLGRGVATTACCSQQPVVYRGLRIFLLGLKNKIFKYHADTTSEMYPHHVTRMLKLFCVNPSSHGFGELKLSSFHSKMSWSIFVVNLSSVNNWIGGTTEGPKWLIAMISIRSWIWANTKCCLSLFHLLFVLFAPCLGQFVIY